MYCLVDMYREMSRLMLHVYRYTPTNVHIDWGRVFKVLRMDHLWGGLTIHPNAAAWKTDTSEPTLSCDLPLRLKSMRWSAPRQSGIFWARYERVFAELVSFSKCLCTPQVEINWTCLSLARKGLNYREISYFYWPCWTHVIANSIHDGDGSAHT